MDEKTKELLATIKAMQDESEARMKALVEKAPEGERKNEEKAKWEEKIASLEATIKELTENMAKADLAKADIDPDDPDAKKGLFPHKFKSMAHFCCDLANEGPGHESTSDELKEWRNATKAAQTVGAGETGGTLVPTEWSSEILERVSQSNPVLQSAQIIPMGTNKIDMPIIMGFDESQGKVAGAVQWYWTAEEAQYTQSNIETGSIELNLRTCTGLARVSRALIKYSPQSIEALLQRAFNEGMSQTITRVALRGTGAGQPKGVLIDGAHKIEVAKASGQQADTFILDNVGAMFARLYSPTDDIAAGTFFANRTVLPQLLNLNVVVGAGGAGVFLINQQVQNSPVYTLLGIPLRFNSKMAVVGDANDVGLFDFSQYLVGQPSSGMGGSMEQSIHLYFDYGATAFRFAFEMDGQPWWPENYRPEYGDPQAPFITLAERA